MAAKTIEMEQIKTIIELHKKGEPIKSIARLTGVARNTVKQYLKRSEVAFYIKEAGSNSRRNRCFIIQMRLFTKVLVIKI